MTRRFSADEQVTPLCLVRPLLPVLSGLNVESKAVTPQLGDVWRAALPGKWLGQRQRAGLGAGETTLPHAFTNNLFLKFLGFVGYFVKEIIRALSFYSKRGN